MKRKIYKILIIAAICFLPSLIETANAQFSISSPYSRFGIGYNKTGQSATLSSMGGIGYAFSRNNEINLLNPASFSAIGSQSFVFNMGFDVTKRKFSNSNRSSDALEGAISNISFAFPVFDKLKIGVSLSPLTQVNYLGSDTILSDVNRVKTFEGNGGIDRFNIGIAYQVMKSSKHDLAIGANVSYFFGNLYRSSTLAFLTQRDTNGVLHDTIGFFDNRTESNYNVSAFGVDFGLQYFLTLNNNDKIGLGLSFTPKHSLSADREQMFYTYYSYGAIYYRQDTLSYSEEDVDITMPMKIGFGFSYDKPNKLFAEMDFTYTKWSDFSFEMQEEKTLKDNWLMNLGLEWIPDANSTKYLNKMAYRFGFHYDNGSIFLQDKRITDVGISFGVALPIKRIGTRINLNFEYGKQGTTDNNLIKETYFRIGFSLSAMDRWFIKRKYQ